MTLMAPWGSNSSDSSLTIPWWTDTSQPLAAYDPRIWGVGSVSACVLLVLLHVGGWSLCGWSETRGESVRWGMKPMIDLSRSPRALIYWAAEIQQDCWINGKSLKQSRLYVISNAGFSSKGCEGDTWILNWSWRLLLGQDGQSAGK